MIIYGNKNYRKLVDSLIIPNVSIKTTKYWDLPIYKVEIKYCKIDTKSGL